jgi:hypothetical protein
VCSRRARLRSFRGSIHFADNEQSVNERIDAKIDKDIKALGQIKTMKAIGIGQRRAPITTEPMKQIESSTIQMVEADYEPLAASNTALPPLRLGS